MSVAIARTPVAVSDHDTHTSERPALRTLPRDVLSHIVRHLSATPHASYWAANVPERVISALYVSGGVPASLAREHFSSLATTSGPWSPHTPPTTTGGAIIVYDKRSSISFAALLSAAAPSLLELRIAHAPRHFAWAERAAHCANLRHLRVAHADATALRAPLCALLEHRGTSLVSIELQGAGGIPASLIATLAAHATAMRNITLEFDALPASICNSLWASRGSQLHSVAVAAFVEPPSSHLFHALRARCTQLHTVRVTAWALPKTAQHALTALLLANGAQLQWFALRGDTQLSVPHWRQVAAVCSNVKVAIQAGSAAEIECAAALGPRLSELSLLLKEETALPPLGNCDALRCLNVTGSSKILVALFRSLRPTMLEEARLKVRARCSSDEDVTSELIDALASRCGALRILHLTCRWQLPRAFDALAAANPDMRDVRICFSGVTAVERIILDQRGETSRVLARIVCAFGRCWDIRSIVIRDVACISRRRFRRVERACSAIRARQVQVLACGVQYVPSH